MAENTSRPCSSVPSRNGLWPSAVHRIHQLQLRRIERVLHGKLGSKDRQQEKQDGDGRRHHGHPGTAERIENIAVERALRPVRAGTRRWRARLYSVGHHGIGHLMSRFRPDG
jgi:hypothetical protein